jgi:DNA-binding SARP family transcriptional activator
MDFRILGPLEISSQDGNIAPVQPLLRSVLCLLLLHAGDRIPRQRLAAMLWGDDLPRDPFGSLRTCVHGVRKALGFQDRLQTVSGGYALVLRDGDFLDLESFRQLRSDGLGASERGDYRNAARFLAQALGCWRDPPLADFPAYTDNFGSVGALLEQRTHTQEALIDARLALGQHRDLVAALRELTASEPLRERFWEQLMLAHYRSGNQAAALEAYIQAHTVLAEECGIEPGPELQKLHRRMLAADPALNVDVAQDNVTAVNHSGIYARLPPRVEPEAGSAGFMGPFIPHELPGTPTYFDDRQHELTVLVTPRQPGDGQSARLARRRRSAPPSCPPTSPTSPAARST